MVEGSEDAINDVSDWDFNRSRKDVGRIVFSVISSARRLQEEQRRLIALCDGFALLYYIHTVYGTAAFSIN